MFEKKRQKLKHLERKTKKKQLRLVKIKKKEANNGITLTHLLAQYQ